MWTVCIVELAKPEIIDLALAEGCFIQTISAGMQRFSHSKSHPLATQESANLRKSSLITAVFERFFWQTEQSSSTLWAKEERVISLQLHKWDNSRKYFSWYCIQNSLNSQWKMVLDFFFCTVRKREFKDYAQNSLQLTTTITTIYIPHVVTLIFWKTEKFCHGEAQIIFKEIKLSQKKRSSTRVRVTTWELLILLYLYSVLQLPV